jgi:hypothetical protein
LEPLSFLPGLPRRRVAADIMQQEGRYYCGVVGYVAEGEPDVVTLDLLGMTAQFG